MATTVTPARFAAVVVAAVLGLGFVALVVFSLHPPALRAVAEAIDSIRLDGGSGAGEPADVLAETTRVAPAPGAADTIAVCGQLPIAPSGDARADRAAVEAALAPVASRVRTATAEALLGSADERAIAAAHFWLSARAPAAAACAARDAACAAAAATAGSQDRDALARLATGGRDPQVYAWALRACAGTAGGPCAALEPGQWARLDPENAAPWQAVAEAARVRGDAAAADEALRRFASARRFESGSGRLVETLLDAAPADDASLPGTWSLGIEAIGIEAATDSAPMQPLFAYCAPERRADATRRKGCDRMAELLLYDSDTLLASTSGVALAERLGWPATRRRPFEADLPALRELGARPWTAHPDPFACDSLAATLDEIRDRGRLGELAYLQYRIQANRPPTVPLLPPPMIAPPPLLPPPMPPPRR